MSGFLRINKDTKEKFDSLRIEMGGVKLKTADDKLNHLMWFFKNYKKK